MRHTARRDPERGLEHFGAANGFGGGGPFAAYYSVCARNFDDDDGTFRVVEELRSIGSAKADLQDVTYEKLVAAWKEYRVTHVCGKKVDPDIYTSNDAKAALTDLTDDERRHLKDALKKRETDVPAILDAS